MPTSEFVFDRIEHAEPYDLFVMPMSHGSHQGAEDWCRAWISRVVRWSPNSFVVHAEDASP
jgi:hypothetical protein